ncbi:MAG: hypothetical protein ACXVA9_09915 [Bdellovibrionales bacterium]
MARLLILTDRAPDDADWKGALIWRIILSLAESQHEVLVATTLELGDDVITHPRLNIIRPVNSWRIDQLPKLAKVLLTYRPQVIHTFALQDKGLWPAFSLWPYFTGMCAVIPGLKRFSTVFDADDTGKSTANWHQQSTRLTVFSQGHSTEFSMQFERPAEIVPLDLDHEGHGEPVDPSVALIPTPVSEWKKPEENLRHVRDLLQRHPETTLRIVGGWGDWEPSRRREGWKILGPVAARVNMTQPMNYRAFVGELQTAGAIWLEPLRRNSWKFLLCTRLANQLGKELFIASPLGFELLPGSTANSLSRLYSLT